MQRSSEISEEGGGIRSGFVRQRRNLILVSLVLLFAQIHQITFSTISVFGTILDLARPFDPQPYLWVAFGYLLYRYHVYFYDIGDKGFSNKQKKRLSRLAHIYARKRFDTDPTLREELHLGLLDKLRMKQAENQKLQDVRPALEDWRFREAGIIGRSDFRHITVQARFMTYSGTGENKSWNHDTNKNIEVEGHTAMSLNIRAGLYVLINTRIISEYFMPYLISAVPLAFCIWKYTIAN